MPGRKLTSPPRLTFELRISRPRFFPASSTVVPANGFRRTGPTLHLLPTESTRQVPIAKSGSTVACPTLQLEPGAALQSLEVALVLATSVRTSLSQPSLSFASEHLLSMSSG